MATPIAESSMARRNRCSLSRDLPAVLDDPANEQGGEEKRRRDHGDRYLQAEFQRLGAELQARQQDRHARTATRPTTIKTSAA